MPDFDSCDHDNTGKIGVVEWANGMRSVIGLDLDWIALAYLLVGEDPAGRVAYIPFLERHRITGISATGCHSFYFVFLGAVDEGNGVGGWEGEWRLRRCCDSSKC